MQEATDFLVECDALASILRDATDTDFQQITQFKDWTVEDVIGHLHIWNRAAAMTLSSRDEFGEFLTYVMQRMGKGDTHPQMQRVWLNEFEGGASGKALFDRWCALYPAIARSYADTDPQQRVAWAGPDMSTQSKIIARQMETWAHGQAIFDLKGIDRLDTDRIRNIAHLGVTTYSWAFRVRSMDPPKPKPFVKLIAPSGAVWTWNDVQEDNMVCADASEFCQVVTQTRNIADTKIRTIGDNAAQWMTIAQCFAGGANPPPAPGTRFKQE